MTTTDVIATKGTCPKCGRKGRALISTPDGQQCLVRGDCNRAMRSRTRVTFVLSPEAAEALVHAGQLTGDDRRVTVDRAILLYQRLVEAASTGGSTISVPMTGDVLRLAVTFKAART